MTARWANDSEQAAIQNKLVALRAVVLAQLPASLATRVPTLDLDTISCKIGVTMPTLNGWLLGYPVCYAVHDTANAESASRCLSTTTLKFYSVFTELQKNKLLRKSEGAEDSPLFAFSMPRNLIESDQWREQKQKWDKTLQKRHEAALSTGTVWGNIIIEETTCMRGIAL
jgi:hypothetical protein